MQLEDSKTLRKEKSTQRDSPLSEASEPRPTQRSLNASRNSSTNTATRASPSTVPGTATATTSPDREKSTSRKSPEQPAASAAHKESSQKRNFPATASTPSTSSGTAPTATARTTQNSCNSNIKPNPPAPTSRASAFSRQRNSAVAITTARFPQKPTIPCPHGGNKDGNALCTTTPLSSPAVCALTDDRVLSANTHTTDNNTSSNHSPGEDRSLSSGGASPSPQPLTDLSSLSNSSGSALRARALAKRPFQQPTLFVAPPPPNAPRPAGTCFPYSHNHNNHNSHTNDSENTNRNRARISITQAVAPANRSTGHWNTNSNVNRSQPTTAMGLRASKVMTPNKARNDPVTSSESFVSGTLEQKPRPPSEQRKEIDVKDKGWRFIVPPNNQRTFFFPEDSIEFSSEFDSGNLIQMERIGAYKYNLYTAMDCGNDERQTNNRQWFHFSVRGGAKGSMVSVTVVGMVHSNMYAFEWMPVMAVLPNRPAYVRLPGKALTTSLDAMPATPDFPMLVYRDPAERRKALEGDADGDADGDGDGEDGDGNVDAEDEGEEASPMDRSPKVKDKAKRNKKKKPVAMNLMFEFRLDYEIPLKSEHPLGHAECPAMYIASNHPYAYSALQRNLFAWQRFAAARAGVSASTIPTEKATSTKLWNYPPNFASSHLQDIYFHREVLCKSLEGRDVDLITITDMHGIYGNDRSGETMPMLTFNGETTPVGFPQSSARKQTQRPRRFGGKQYVVLSARVHAGECPGSHMMHGCFEFLMNPKDLRAIALRRHFVFFLVPMLNPDGVVRGHSRVDANGVDLNRMYRTPSSKRHPAAYSLWALLSSLAAEKKLALYVDMHAHANKRGTFFYGNGMDAGPQVDNLLYARLVALNTPYLEFKSCNYSESNMSAVTRSGLSKDCSCRVVLYTETGVIHSYAIEASHVAGKSLNSIVPLASIPGEEIETVASTRYSPATFADTGKAMLLALLDLKGVNPASRVPLSPYQSVKGISQWLQRQLQIELSEKLFAQAYKDYGRVEPTDPSQTPVAAILSKLTPEEVPEKVTVRNCRHLPPTTVSHITDFVPLELANTLLAQTPASAPPRTLVCAAPRRKTTPPSAITTPTTQGPPRQSLMRSSSNHPSGAAAAGEGRQTLSRGPGDSPVTTRPTAAVSGAKRTLSQRSLGGHTVPMDDFTLAVIEASTSPTKERSRK